MSKSSNIISKFKGNLVHFINKRLSKYDHSDFATKQKVRLFYPICITGIISLFVLLGSSIYTQLASDFQALYYPVLIAEVLLIVVFLICLRLLTKGYYNISAQVFLVSSNVVLWFVMFVNQSDIISKLDTIVLMLAIVNVIPLFISKNYKTIFVYVIFNIILLIVFAFNLRINLLLDKAQMIDYIIDTTIALSFVGVAGYQLLKINNRVLNQVETDYQEKLKTEQELAESEYRYHNLFENAQIGIYQTTPEGVILKANPAMLELHGLKSFDEVAHKNLNEVDVFVNKNRNEFIEKIERDGFVKDFESTWIKQNGESIIVRENSRAVRNEKGETLYYEGFIVNITEQKKAEEIIKDSELKYTTLFENAQIGIFQATPEGEIIKVNPALVQMLGYESVEELVGLNLITDHFFVNPDRSRFEELMATQGFVNNFESEWYKKNGDKIIIKENSRTVRDRNGNRLYLEGFIENITERKEIEKALKENEEKYRSLMENMNDIVMLVDNDDKVLYVNKRFSEKLGYSRTEIIGEIGYKFFVDPKDKETILKANNDRIKNKASQYEATVIAKDGTKYDFLISGTPVRDAEGEVIGSIGNMIDITERKIAEEKLKESQQLFQNLAQVSPVGIFRTRPDGYTTYVNPRWTEISGLSFDEAVGNGWLKAVHPDDRKTLGSDWKLFSSQGEKSSAEYRFLKKDGSIAWVLGNAVPEIINGEIQGYIGTITDITERKVAERTIKESEERYKTIIEAFPDIIMISDLRKNILFANKLLQEVTGITPEEYNDPNRKAQIHPDDMPFVQKKIKELLKSNKTHTEIIENRFVDKWGKTHWFSGIISKMYYNNELVLQTITRDITEKKDTEQELAKYRQHLEFLVKERTEELEATNEELTSTNEELHSQREELQVTLRNLQDTQKQLIQAEKMASLGILASGVAHEINNPLNFIKGGAFGLEDYLQENLPDHLKSVKLFLHSINEGVDRAANIVTSLNHYSRRDDTKISECNIHQIIDNCLNILANQIRDIINIEKDYTKKAFTLRCNEGKMHQAILNILTNAVQSINDEGKITIKTTLKNKQLKIIMSDTGVGISKENLQKIFDPFFTTKNPGEGTGLGLSITYNIIEEHSGNIEINSKLYKGTNVFITLPIEKV